MTSSDENNQHEIIISKATSDLAAYSSSGFIQRGNELSCYLPKEVDAASEHKQSNFDFKTSGSDSMN